MDAKQPAQAASQIIGGATFSRAINAVPSDGALMAVGDDGAAMSLFGRRNARPSEKASRARRSFWSDLEPGAEQIDVIVGGAGQRQRPADARAAT